MRGSHLVQGKLVCPSPPAAHVPRDRLSGKLGALLEAERVVAICATAGAGKSTAAAAAVRTFDRPVSWLTVDWTDVAPGRLVTYLEASLASNLEHLHDVATDAMANGIPHAEAAAILAEAIGDQPLVLVIDELERLGTSAEPWSVIESFLRYAPAGVHTLLISRRALPVRLPGIALPVLGELDLAFTSEEASQALEQLGQSTTEAAGIVEATGGWVTGVLFEAWRLDQHVAGTGGDANPLHGYLSAHILDQLDADDREFLIQTSLLDEVTDERASRLGLTRPGERLASLQAAHVPVSWTSAGSMRCHSCFREFLLERLTRRGAEELAALRIRYGHLLLAERHDEEATEEFLLAGAFDEALAPAVRAITGIIERRDFEIAARWLDTLDAAEELTTAELMLAVARDDFRAGVRVADQLAAIDKLEDVARSSDYAAILLTWVYLHHGRSGDVRAILAALSAGPVADTIRYALQLYEDLPAGHEAIMPELTLTGGPLDALMLVASYAHGRHIELLQLPESGWLDAATDAYRIAALRAIGRVEQALELHDATQRRTPNALSLNVFVHAELLVDAGRRADAAQSSATGRELAVAVGGVSLQGMNSLVEIKRLVRLERDLDGARAVLARIDHEGGRALVWIREIADMWAGVIALLEGQDQVAAAKLRWTVGSMLSGDRLLELQPAAVYLAEAEWRLGNEEESDRAADLALDIVKRQGSSHGMLKALADFPAVASRRLDAEPRGDSAWHSLGRALVAQGVSGVLPIAPTVMVREFGALSLVINGAESQPRLTKSLELLSFLVTRPERTASREELLEALFDGRSHDGARSYVRQAVHQLRLLLDDTIEVVVDRGGVRIGDTCHLTSESTTFEARIAEAGRLVGEDRLRKTSEALSIFDRGPYLPRARSEWADKRREDLLLLATDARFECAELAFADGDLDRARQYHEGVLNIDPLRESAWRLRMRIACALGDDDAVIQAFRACEGALAKIDAVPSRRTRQLLEDLRS